MLPVFQEVQHKGGEKLPRTTLRERIGRLADDLRGPLSEYLLDSTCLMVTQSDDDPLDPSKKRSVPHGWITDGEWAWPAYWGYFVKNYGVEVPAEFIEHARSKEFRPDELSEDELERAAQELENQFGSDK
ncbi:hypothetical protein BJY24_003547 [Nocardia transvalensis]|uniref:Uncharacterized protein n=1 Tax=Nocardia transvalensis TaxID=37333 RepID=A0A7W9PF13_9NOCA|nr:hypothetical protein [Nocardia transvalensis]MBB5914680.1 hypothetical protein [Nocardia transvalensis]